MSLSKNKLTFGSVSLWVFVITILSYAVTLLYQMAYFSSFGVSEEILSIKTDPSALLLSGIIISAISVLLLFFYAVLKIIPAIFNRLSKLALPVGDILVLLLTVYILTSLAQKGYVLSPNLVFSFKGVDWLTSIGFLGTVVLYVGLKATAIVLYKIKKHASWAQSYVRFTPDPRKERVNKYTISPIYVLAVFGLITLMILPEQLGHDIAKKKVDFIAIRNQEYNTEADKITLIIGKTNDGYIVKKYSLVHNDFDSSYALIEMRDLTFEPYRINK